ncbi:BcKU70, protein [Halenospora varia]|nr:BcKU70, protein [Halenospora varia]
MADSTPSWKKNDEEDEDEELDETNYIAQKDAVLFAIEVSDSMLTRPPPSDSKNADTDSPTLTAIQCAYQIMQQRIISSPKDMMGVLLFGTEKSKFQEEDASSRGSSTYPHCYLLSDLNVPSAEDVKELKKIIEEPEEADELLVPTKEAVSMGNLLFCANQIFTTRAPNFGSRRLFIISDNDDPHPGDKSARSQATVRAKDLYDLGVTIELFPISHPDHDFDRSKFYDDIIYRDPAEESDTVPGRTNFKSSGDGISLLSNLVSDINSKQVAKRTLFSNLPFEIGPGFKISVKGYNLLQRQVPARSCYVWMDGEEPQIALGESSRMEEDSAKVVEKAEIKKAYKFGGTQVLFTPEEQKELKNFGPPGLRIIGFKLQSMLPFWASIKKSTFIYPSEEDYVGSTRVFSALWKKLLDDKKMGVAWYIARSNANPQLVAILPSPEKLDENTNAQTFPAGLWLYPLPFADDLRNPPDQPAPVIAPDNIVDPMIKIVQQLQLPKAVYDPSKYPNPSLQWHYRILQAMALDEATPEQSDDKTIPKYRQINKRCGEYIHQWGLLLEEQFRLFEKERRTNRGPESEGPPPKKARTTKTESLEGLSIDDLKKAATSGSLGKHSVAELKGWLASKGLSSSGKKQDLIDRMEQWIEDN